MAKAQDPAKVGDRIKLYLPGNEMDGQQGEVLHINHDGQLIINLDNFSQAYSCYPSDVILLVD